MKTTGIDRLTGSARGSYVLILHLPESRTIPVGKLGSLEFPSGYYAYAGSALNGLKSRLARHLRTEKKLHWHIDYLLRYAHIRDILVVESGDRLECTIAAAIGGNLSVIEGFGSSDCRCPGHLYYSEGECAEDLRTTLEETGLIPLELKVKE